MEKFRNKIFNEEVFEKYLRTLPSTKENSLIKNGLFKNVSGYKLVVMQLLNQLKEELVETQLIMMETLILKQEAKDQHSSKEKFVMVVQKLGANMILQVM